MSARLYVTPLSNPAAAGAAMLAYKGVAHRVVRLPLAAHPLLVRLAGFPGWTVPALELDGRKVQGTLEISRALDDLRPDPPLFPSERESRRPSSGGSVRFSRCRAGSSAGRRSRTPR